MVGKSDPYALLCWYHKNAVKLLTERSCYKEFTISYEIMISCGVQVLPKLKSLCNKVDSRTVELALLIYWPAKERLQNIDAICFIVKTKNSNWRT